MIDKNTVILRDAARGDWLHFRDPLHILQTTCVDEVGPLFRRVEAEARARGLYGVGFLSYEAAPAFDSALTVRQADDFPLLWFGLYRQPQRIALPDSTDAPRAAAFAWQPTVEAARYQSAIREIKQQIAAGRTYQVNYTMRLQAPFVDTGASGDEAWAFFLRLVRAQQPSFGAYLMLDRYTICCASPELFFRLDKGQLTTRPMKGTAPRGLTWDEDQTQAAWLRTSEKNRAENVMIVDMIRNDLGRVAEVGSVSVPQLFAVEKYPSVWQMTSTVTARTTRGVSEVMQALFPCASITGAPKHSTMQIIANLEETPRRIYTGSIGYISPEGNAQFNVAIRTALVDRQKAVIEYGAGGGVVWDSTSEGEWEECLVKTRILTWERPSFALLETMLWRRGDGYVLLDYHLRRLMRSAATLDYRLDIEAIERRLQETARAFRGYAYRVRLLVNRDGSTQLQTTEMSWPFPEEKEARRVCLAPAPVSSKDLFLYHKTTHRVTYERMRASCPGFEDVILWNERDEITESCLANVIVALDGEQVTPPISSGLLAGTYRQWLLDQGLVRERVVLREDLARCTGLWLVNSVRGEMRAELEEGLATVEVANPN